MEENNRHVQVPALSEETVNNHEVEGKHASQEEPPKKEVPESKGEVISEQDRLDRESDRDLREHSARDALYIAWFALFIWFCAFLVRVVAGFLCNTEPAFSDKAFITVTTGATANALGVFAIVVTGLFINERSQSKKARLPAE